MPWSVSLDHFIKHKHLISEEFPPKLDIFCKPKFWPKPDPTKDPSKDSLFIFLIVIYYFQNPHLPRHGSRHHLLDGGLRRRRGFIILISFLIKRCSLRAHYITTPGDGVVAPLLPHVICMYLYLPTGQFLPSKRIINSTLPMYLKFLWWCQ